MWECKKCNEQVDEELNICWNCSSDKSGNVNEYVPESPSNEENNKSRNVNEYVPETPSNEENQNKVQWGGFFIMVSGFGFLSISNADPTYISEHYESIQLLLRLSVGSLIFGGFLIFWNN